MDEWDYFYDWEDGKKQTNQSCEQSYTFQVLQTFEKDAHQSLLGRLACTSSKTEILNKIGI